MSLLKKIDISDQNLLKKIKFIKKFNSGGGEFVNGYYSPDGKISVLSTYDRIIYQDQSSGISWKKPIPGIQKLAVSTGFERIAAVTVTTITVLNRGGGIEWTWESTDGINYARISFDGQLIAVSHGRNVSMFTSGGNVLWTHEFQSHVKKMIFISDLDSKLFVLTEREIFSISEEGYFLWQFRFDGYLRDMDINMQEKVAFTTRDGDVKIVYRGNIIWEAEVPYAKFVAFSDNGEVLVVGSTDKKLYGFSFGDFPQWYYEVPDFIRYVEISKNGETVVVGVGSDIFGINKAMIFDGYGKLLWSITIPGSVKSTRTSVNGEIVYVTASRQAMIIDNSPVTYTASEKELQSAKKLYEDIRSRSIFTGNSDAILNTSRAYITEKKYGQGMDKAREAYKYLKIIESRYVNSKSVINQWLKEINTDFDLDEKHLIVLFPLYNTYEDISSDKIFEETLEQIKNYRKELQSLKKKFQRVLTSISGAGDKALESSEIAKKRLNIILMSINNLMEIEDMVSEFISEKTKIIEEIKEYSRILIIDWISGVPDKPDKNKLENFSKTFDILKDQMIYVMDEFETVKTGARMHPSTTSVSLKLSPYEIEGSNWKFKINILNKEPITINDIELRVLSEIGKISCDRTKIDIASIDTNAEYSTDVNFLVKRTESYFIRVIINFRDIRETLKWGVFDFEFKNLIPSLKPFSIAKSSVSKSFKKGDCYCYTLNGRTSDIASFVSFMHSQSLQGDKYYLSARDSNSDKYFINVEPEGEDRSRITIASTNSDNLALFRDNIKEFLMKKYTISNEALIKNNYRATDSSEEE